MQRRLDASGLTRESWWTTDAKKKILIESVFLVGGNLITCKGSTSTRTANLTTSKLLWNSVLSTEGTKYMCLDIKNFYLTAALDYYEYMTHWRYSQSG